MVQCEILVGYGEGTYGGGVYGGAVETEPDYYVEVDWFDNGNFTDPNDDVSSHLTMQTAVTTSYGRDDARRLSPIASGTINFELCDPNALFSPDNPDSPLMNDVRPGRPLRTRIHHDNDDHIIFNGFIDDLDVRPSKYTDHVPLSGLDGIAKLNGVRLSTELHRGIQTGTAIGLILDEIGWPPDARQIDVGATTIPYWWEEGTDAFTAVERIINSEGPPAIAYVEPSTGDFVFRDRHHRIQDPRSNAVQATFCTTTISGCDVTGSPCPTGSFGYTDPFEYDSGWRNIINHVSFNVDVYRRAQDATEIWKSTSTITTPPDESVLPVKMVFSEPVADISAFFFDNVWGVGTLNDISVNRTSGQSVTAFISSSGGPVTIGGLALYGHVLEVVHTVSVEREDTESIDIHGVRSWPNTDAPFLNRNDADDITQIILAHYADKTSIVKIRVAMCDDSYLSKILDLRIGDQIEVHNQQMNVHDVLYTLERIEHTIRGRRREGHSVVLTCLEQKRQLENAFTFDVAGLGFDDGVFGLSGFITDSEVFKFDVVGQGFDQGKFAY